MSIHPDGTGTGWTNVEAVDVNQPHGKDYLYSQHIAKGVRKRMNQEHSTFADATVGGIHTPGGCAVLGMEITDDCTAPVVGDGTYRGHGLLWSLSKDTSNFGVLWCSTKAAGSSTTGDWTVLKMHPDLQWSGQDVTWAGAHEFDASVDISGNVAMDGDLTIDGVLKVDSSCEISDVYINGDISMTGSIKVATDVSITGDMAIDGTSNFYGECDFSVANVYLSINGTPTKVYTKFLTGNLDADAATDVAHGCVVANILSVSVIAYDDVLTGYRVSEHFIAADADAGYTIYYDAANIKISNVGADLQGNAYRIRIEYT